MCETTVIVVKKGSQERLMDNVSLINVEGENIKISGLLGETMTVKGRITKIDSERHEILIE
jgi:predicted RNA-binding protein